MSLVVLASQERKGDLKKKGCSKETNLNSLRAVEKGIHKKEDDSRGGRKRKKEGRELVRSSASKTKKSSRTAGVNNNHGQRRESVSRKDRERDEG